MFVKQEGCLVTKVSVKVMGALNTVLQFRTPLFLLLFLNPTNLLQILITENSFKKTYKI